MAKRATERRTERIALGLCIYCGVRPSFWGLRCIICRSMSAKDPLPQGARRALRHYRKTEEQRLLDLTRKDAQEAARKLLESGKVRGKPAKTLRLYMGLDDGKWRNYREIARLVNVSVERVRQLLLLPKTVLSETLSDRVPWRRLKGLDSNGKRGRLLPAVACNHRKDAGISHDGYYVYRECGLPNVVLFGLTTRRCQGCQGEAVSIPQVDDLDRILAAAVLLKPASLTGRELRFLRTVAGLPPVTLAQQLDVTLQTIASWEKSTVLRAPNDLAARTLIAQSIVSQKCLPRLFKVLGSIETRSRGAFRLRASWINDKSKWAVSSQLIKP